MFRAQSDEAAVTRIRNNAANAEFHLMFRARLSVVKDRN